VIPAPPTNWYEVHRAFGNPSYTELSGGLVDLDDAWESQNLVLVRKVCGTGLSIRLHYRLVYQFQEAFSDALRRCPGYAIRLMGGFAPRHKMHDPKRSLSIHSFGAAVDFNWDTNPVGKTLKTDLPDDFVECFRSRGWDWGGAWKSIKDPMHFQFAIGV
jgi:hypothetical protein